MPITGFYTAILAILIVFLILNVVKYRRSEKIGLGDGGNKIMNCAIRAHGNAVETIPICLLLLALAEMNGSSHTVLHIFGGILVVARLLHPWGMISGKGGVSFGRFFGTILTFVVILGLAVTILINVYPKIF